MKKISYLFSLLFIFVGMNVVLADEFGDYTYYNFSYDYTLANGERVLTCTYHDCDKSLKAQMSYENGIYQVKYVYEGGKKDANVELEPIADLKEGQISAANLDEYLRTYQTCPTYAVQVGESYYFSNKLDSDSSKYLIITKTKYNNNYCYYKFDASTRWGMFIHKDYLDNLEDGYESDEKACPSSITMELKLFSYGTIPSHIFSNKVDVNECRKRVSELHPEYSDDLKCYTGNLVDTNDEQIENQTENLYDPNNILSCTTQYRKDKYDPNQLLNCEAIFDEESKKFISNAYFFLELVAIALIIVFTIGDYASAMLQSNQDDIKKSNSKLIKRLIILAVLFLLPSILRFLLRITNIDLFDTRSPYCDTINMDD